MRHKKKRSAPSQRNPDQLDYSDEPPLDSREYQEAIRAHLNEFDDSANRQSKGINGSHNGMASHDQPLASKRASQSRQTSAISENHVLTNKSGSKKSGKNVASSVDQSKDRIWNTTSNEERERIKEFWLNLSVDERRSLVKVEKEAVLKKMKDQQKQSCSCSLCGRKRSAIEEELEILYDAYYEELELYANRQQYPPQEPVSVSRHALPRISHAPRHGKITEVLHSDDEGSFDDDEEEEDLSDDDLLTEDDLSDDEEEEIYSDEEEEEYGREDRAIPEFLEFGSSLKVKGGILSVADDLLQNDGRRFIEMMEKLAGRRLERQKQAEEHEAEFDEADLDDDDYYDEDELDSEDQYEEDYDLNPDAKQKMEEGRRMFQIFAASMFEQRVLTAYREKVAQERQALLLQELELEDSREKEREAKKAKEKEKKKDKKRQQQLKKEEEKARKEAERLAEEAAQKAEEDRKAEETRKRKEEQRIKREAEKKLLEAERLRKEEEKRKRIAEEKAREAKRLEQLAKEKKAKEEALRKEREAKAAATKEAKARNQAKLQRELETSAKPAEAAKIPALSTPQYPIEQTPQRISPPAQSFNNASTAATPAVPKSLNSKEMPQTKPPSIRHFAEGPQSATPRNIPIPSHQQRPLTPGALSPQQPFGSQQNSFPRAALGHPPSMPVPLPPPGIGGHNSNPHSVHHDAFAFGNQQPQQSHVSINPMHARPMNGHANGHMPGMQGPPGVFASAPTYKPSTSPQSRIGTPVQTTRFVPPAPFASFNGLGSGTTSRDEPLHHDNEMSAVLRRTSSILDNGPGSIGAIGRPSPARVPSVLPAPIQRPSAITAPTKRNGFDTDSDVLGSRALLDDDDPIVDERSSGSIFSAGTKWTSTPFAGNVEAGLGSAALNGSVDEPFHPPRNASLAQGSIADRWGSAGPIGSKGAFSDERFANVPHNPNKPATWGF